MNSILRPALLSLALVGTLASCDTLASLNPAAALTGGGGQDMVEMMKDQSTPYVLSIAPNTAVGQWWEHTMMGGTTQRFSVVAEMDGKFVVEQVQDMGGSMVVQAWLVDPSVDTMQIIEPGQPAATNVSKAWIGLEGEAPVERPVAEAYIMPEPVEGVEVPEFTEGTDRVTLAGQEWNTKWVEAAGSRTWTDAESGFMLKSVYNGDVMMELSGYGMDAESALAWE